MAGPWEQYAPTAAPVQTESGPWSAYGPAPAPAQEAVPGGTTTIPAQGGAPTRVIMDMGKTAAPDRGVVDALGRGAAQGVTANFYDELKGIAAAGGAEQGPEFIGGGRREGIDHLIMGLAKYWFGDEQAKAKYDEVVGRERADLKQAEEQHPVASIGGNIAGAVALPIGAGAGAATMLPRVLAGGGVGGLMGGASGVGGGVGAADSATQGAVGTAAGTVLGAAAPPVLNVLGKGLDLAGRGISKAAQPIIQNWRGYRNPDAEAARRILRARATDAASAKPGLTQAEFDAAKASGSPVINADMGGEATQALARSAANTSPPGRAALQTVTSERYATQSPRMAGWLKDTFDFPSPGPALERLQEAARRENRPAYIKAYSEGANLPFDDGLAQISQAPTVQDAIRMAMVSAKNEAAKLDIPTPKNPFRFDVDGRVQLAQNPDGSMMTPNLQFWDIVKRNLDKTGTQEAKQWARILRDHLDDLVGTGSYKEARAGAAKFFGAEEALEAGANFATMSGRDALTIDQARKALSQFKPGERKLFEAGFVSNLIAKVEDLKDGQDVVKQIFNSEFARKQINLVLGSERAAELEAKLLAERAMNGIKNAVQGNSTTIRQRVELGLAGGATGVGGMGVYDMDPQKIGAAALTGAILAGGRKIDQRVARRVAEMLASDDPKVLDAGIKLVSRSPVLRDVLLNLNLPFIKAGSQQASGIPAIQAGGAVRADEQQQPVPGPVN